MHAMLLRELGSSLEWTQLAEREPEPSEIRVKVAACGVCRTDLHVIDGELSHPQLPIIPGHEIVGRIDALGSAVNGLSIGERVGIPWLGHTCGVCPYCVTQRENLCDKPLFTGYTRDGGFATAVVADARFAFPLGEAGDDVALAISFDIVEAKDWVKATLEDLVPVRAGRFIVHGRHNRSRVAPNQFGIVRQRVERKRRRECLG